METQKEYAVHNRFSIGLRSIIGLWLLLLLASPAAAQATRTWVSGVGNDANPCSRTAPCITWAGALSKTAAGGEIDALDPGGFGAVTLNKAITLDGGGGQIAGVLVSGTNGIVVNAGASDVVIIRNLQINGIGSGINGVRALAGKELIVDHCNVFGFTQNGIDVAPTSTMNILVTESRMYDNAGSGIRVTNGGAFFARVTVTRSTLDRNGTGLTAADNSLVFVADSHASNNIGNGWVALPAFGGPAQIDLENATGSNNGNTGILSQNPTAVVRVSNTTIGHNGGAGVVSLAGGQILSFGNNRSMGNASGDGAATGGAVTVF